MTGKLYQFTFKEEENARLDRYLAFCLSDYSRARIQRLIKDGFVLVNKEKIQKNGFQLEAGNVIDVTIPPSKAAELIPEDIPLDVIYEDEDVVVINKPAGMVVHPAAGHSTGTLIHAALSRFPEIEGVGGIQRPGIIHRLDKDTSGLIVFAKNDKTHQWIMKQFSSRKVKKNYLALVDGHPPTPEGRIEAPIGRDPSDRKKMAVVDPKKGREAFTEYFTLKSYTHHDYLDVHLLTGRTHQIRVHMKFIGCPVVGDIVYGRKNPTVDIERTFLHAAHLEFFMPGEKEPRKFDAPLPEELDKILACLN